MTRKQAQAEANKTKKPVWYYTAGGGGWWVYPKSHRLYVHGR